MNAEMPIKFDEVDYRDPQKEISPKPAGNSNSGQARQNINEIMRLLMPMVRKIVIRDPEIQKADREDIIQDALVALLQEYEPKGKPDTEAVSDLLAKIRNKVFTSYRGFKNKAANEATLHQAANAVTIHDKTVSQWAKAGIKVGEFGYSRYRLNKLRDSLIHDGDTTALAVLNYAQRQETTNAPEISKALRIHLNTVYSALHRIRKKLKGKADVRIKASEKFSLHKT